jgi:3-deoxy-7-phosphoheptulonate synthase
VQPIDRIRAEIQRLDSKLLELLAERRALSRLIGAGKQAAGLPVRDPERERELMAARIAEGRRRSLDERLVTSVFGEILRDSVRLQQGAEAAERPPSAAPAEAATPVARPDAGGGPQRSYWLAGREHRREDTVVAVGAARIGADGFAVIAGPCAVESEEQVTACAREVEAGGGTVLRGGCFKMRTSPYSFQGLGWRGLDHLVAAGRACGLPVVTEVVSPQMVPRVAERVDMLQVGSRNMQNVELLRAVGRVRVPVLLKRGFMASLDELLQAAEYVLAEGNAQVVLCERGIRTFETSTRNTLDLSSVPVLRSLTHLPVLVDPSHAAGHRAWVPALARAARMVGAHGVMIEIHPHPEAALCDGPQAVRFEEFQALMVDLIGSSAPAPRPVTSRG